MSDFNPLEIVGRSSGTKLQVPVNLNGINLNGII